MIVDVVSIFLNFSLFSFFFEKRPPLFHFRCIEILTSYSLSFSRGQFNNVFASVAIVFRP